MRRTAGFTLIELLVVVGIIGVLSAFLLPFLARMRQQSRGTATAEVSEIAQPAPTAEAIPATQGETTRMPVLESSDVHVELTAAPVFEGLSVQTRYRARFAGTFLLRNVDPASDRVRFRFPFPAEMAEARDVTLQVGPPSGALAEAADATFDVTGVEWLGRVAPREAVRLVVAYAAEGRNAFGYRPTGSGRSGKVRVEIELKEGRRPTIPSRALTPTEVRSERLTWSLDNVVTQRAIIVELPPGASPLGRLIHLCQLAGLAVFLFGAGFWYLNELRRPGALDDFRLGHFLLLALNYCLFFVVFAVVGFSGAVGPALVAGAVTGLPLLALHGARITDTGFSLTRILPLAVFTLALVIGGVYVEEGTEYVYLGGAVAVLGFVTVTYRGWLDRRKALREAAARERAARGRGTELRESAAPLAPALEQASDLLQEVERELARASESAAPEDLAGLRAVAERVRRLADQAREGLDRLARLGKDAGTEAHAQQVEAVGAALKGPMQYLALEVKALRGDLQALRQRRAARASGADPGGATHCAACGAQAPVRLPFCAHCGRPTALLLPCPRCGRATELPQHLVPDDWRTKGLHCAGCGEKVS